MNTRDQISKASYAFVESVKRNVSKTVQELVSTGGLKIDKREMPGLIYVLQAAVEAGYQEAQIDFMRRVDVALDKGSVENKRGKIKALLGIKGR